MKNARECPGCGYVAFKAGGLYKCPRCGKQSGNKFNARQTKVNGITYDSAAEREYYENVLAWRERLGEISKVKHHTVIELLPGINFETDFDYIEKGIQMYVDVKGKEQGRWMDVKRLWPYFGPGPLHVVKRSSAKSVRWASRTIFPGQWRGKQINPTKWVWTKVA